MTLLIRRYQPSDRSALRQIAFDTALMGQNAEIFFDGEEFLKDLLTAYFTDHEPLSAWVAESNGEVIGYIIGAKDESVMTGVFMASILPGLLVAIFRDGILLKPKNWKLFKGFLKSLLNGEFKMSDVSHDYPAVLHINMKEGARGGGTGSALIKALVEDFTRAGVKGVRLATMSTLALDFFKKNGFTLLFEGKRSYFCSAIGKDVPLYVLGRKLG